MSAKTVQKVDTEDTNEVENVVDDWFTMEEVAEHKGIKPSTTDYEQKCLACVKGLPSRDHEDKNLAALGVKQFKYCTSKRSKQVVKKRRLEINEHVDGVSAEDFAGMRNAMGAGSAQKMITSGGCKGTGQNSSQGDAGLPGTEVAVDWQKAFKHQQKKLKQQVASIGSEVHTLDVMVTHIEGKPDDEMKPIALKQLKALKTKMEEKKAEFLGKQLAIPKEVADDKAEEETQAIVVLTKEIQQSMQKWKKDMSVHKHLMG